MSFSTPLWTIVGSEDFCLFLHEASTTQAESKVIAGSGGCSSFASFFHRSTLSTTTGVYLLTKRG